MELSSRAGNATLEISWSVDARHKELHSDANASPVMVSIVLYRRMAADRRGNMGEASQYIEVLCGYEEGSRFMDILALNLSLCRKAALCADGLYSRQYL